MIWSLKNLLSEKCSFTVSTLNAWYEENITEWTKKETTMQLKI